MPGDSALPTRADGLHARLFGREARRVALKPVRPLLHIGDFAGSEDAIDKSRAKTFDGFADPIDFGQVHAGTDDHFNSAPVVVMVSRPCLTPFVLIRTSATLRTSPDRPRTTSTSRQLS